LIEVKLIGYKMPVRLFKLCDQSGHLYAQVSQEEFVQSACNSIEVQKKVHAKIKLVKIGSLPPIELGKMKSYILNSKSQGEYSALID
jgi:hypothetical protein